MCAEAGAGPGWAGPRAVPGACAHSGDETGGRSCAVTEQEKWDSVLGPEEKRGRCQALC